MKIMRSLAMAAMAAAVAAGAVLAVELLSVSSAVQAAPQEWSVSKKPDVWNDGERVRAYAETEQGAVAVQCGGDGVFQAAIAWKGYAGWDGATATIATRIQGEPVDTRQWDIMEDGAGIAAAKRIVTSEWVMGFASSKTFAAQTQRYDGRAMMLSLVGDEGRAEAVNEVLACGR